MNNDYLFIWRNRLYNKFYIIRNVDIHAGFCAIMVYVLNGIRKAHELGAIPVIDFNKDNTPEFYSKAHGEYIWDYFFEPVSAYTAGQVKSFVNEGMITPDAILLPTSAEVMRIHHEEEDRLATFWAKNTPSDKQKWLAQKRALGREYIQKYISVRPGIVAKVDAFISAHFKNQYMIGIHIRGTDFAYASPTPITRYFEETDGIIKQKGKKDCLVFLATDQQQYLEAFQARYKDKLVYSNALRSDNHIAPFRLAVEDGYRKGEDVLIDVLILAACNHVLKGAAAVGEMALWFNDSLLVTDFSIQSEFYQKPYYKLEAAFSRLNIGEKSVLRLSIDRFRAGLVRKIQDSVIGKKLFIKFSFVRKILKH